MEGQPRTRRRNADRAKLRWQSWPRWIEWSPANSGLSRTPGTGYHQRLPRLTHPGSADFPRRQAPGRAAWLHSVVIGFLLPATLSAAPAVRVLRTPGGGLQPQAALDSKGTLHLVYLAGEPSAADVFHVTRAPGATVFGTPRQVNHHPGSAIAVGTIRGAQVSRGRGYRTRRTSRRRSGVGTGHGGGGIGRIVHCGVLNPFPLDGRLR